MRHARRWVACSEQATLAPTLSLTTEQCSIGRWSRFPPSTSRISRSWCARTRLAPPTASPIIAASTHALLGWLRTDRAGPLSDPSDPRGCLGYGARPGRSERENGQVCEITDRVDLSSWPERSRLIVRRERPHPGAQLSFTDHDGYRFQAILTDQDDQDIAVLECRHRQHAHVEDRIRDDKDTGLSKFPFKEFALNEVWLEIVMLAHDLIVWTQALAYPRAREGRAQAAALPTAARRRAARVPDGRGQAPPPRHMAVGSELRGAFQKLRALPAPAG